MIFVFVFLRKIKITSLIMIYNPFLCSIEGVSHPKTAVCLAASSRNIWFMSWLSYCFERLLHKVIFKIGLDVNWGRQVKWSGLEIKHDKNTVLNNRWFEVSVLLWLPSLCSGNYLTQKCKLYGGNVQNIVSNVQQSCH